MPAYFITATGTNLGKTLVTAALCWQLRMRRISVRAIKPVVTGVDSMNWKNSDTAQLLEAMENPVDAMALKQVSPWRFADPVSPHFAARKAGAELTLEEVVDFCGKAIEQDGITLIEGAGGIQTPLTERHTMLDLVVELDVPVILLCGSYVGAISHTLSAITALNANGVKIQAVLVNESTESASSLAETAEAIRQFAGLNLPIFTLPRLAPAPQLWKDMPNFTEMLGL